MSEKHEATPTWEEFSALLMRCRLATSFREHRWNRYSRQHKRELYRITKECFEGTAKPGETT